MTAITRLYDSYSHARSVVRDLRTIGILDSEISVVANSNATTVDNETSNTATGASVGAAQRQRRDRHMDPPRAFRCR